MPESSMRVEVSALGVLSSPLATGPASWSLTSWIGVAIYLVVFLALLYVIYRVAEPGIDDSGEDGD